MKKAIGYVRVSTTKQELSPEAKEAKIRAAATLYDCEILEIITDQESGKSLNREGARRMMVAVETRQVDCVIVAKLDRLTRSIRDLQDILDTFAKHDVSLISISESLDTASAAGRLVMNIMAAVSQWEREAIGERTREALQHKKKQGGRVGTIPYGYRLEAGKLIPDLEELNLLSNMRFMHDVKKMSYQQIADECKQWDIKNRKGKTFSKEGIYHLLTKGE